MDMTTRANDPRSKFVLLLLFVLQNSLTVLVGRHTRSSVSKDEAYELHYMLLTTEILKVSLLAD